MASGGRRSIIRSLSARKRGVRHKTMLDGNNEFEIPRFSLSIFELFSYFLPTVPVKFAPVPTISRKQKDVLFVSEQVAT